MTRAVLLFGTVLAVGLLVGWLPLTRAFRGFSSWLRLLVAAFGCSLVLLVFHFACLWHIAAIGVWTSEISLGFLDSLYHAGLPTMAGPLSETESIPDITPLGAILFYVPWWLVYFVVISSVAIWIGPLRLRGARGV